MQVRYYVDGRTDLPYIYGHDVSELEVEQVLERPAEDRSGDEQGSQADGKPLLAHRRRKRRNPQ